MVTAELKVKDEEERKRWENTVKSRNLKKDQVHRMLHSSSDLVGSCSKKHKEPLASFEPVEFKLLPLQDVLLKTSKPGTVAVWHLTIQTCCRNILLGD